MKTEFSSIISIAILLIFAPISLQVKPIDNGLAPPEIVHRVIAEKNQPLCKIVGKPLDLLFVLDSSGSLKNKFDDELNVIREVVNIVAIGEHSTRVGLVQFSGTQRTEFHLNTFFSRRNVIQAVDTLRHVSGITQTGAALEYSTNELTEEMGMRGSEVPKIVFLLSDGRTHDHPMDKVWAQRIREMLPGLSFWAYGTGDYVAMSELINITQDESKIVTNKNIHHLADLFNEYRGTEVCEDVPICIPGSDKPLDLIFVVDGSNSIEGRFNDQLNIVRMFLNNANVHPDAVRVAFITYSGQPNLHFDFQKFTTRDQILDYLLTLRPMNRTTQTKLALKMAFDTFSLKHGMRNESVPKMAVVLTDGHSASSPAAFARRLVRLKNVVVAAVAVSPERLVDAAELLEITDQNRSLVFTKSNLHALEDWFLQYVTFSCPGLDVSREDIEPYVRGPTEIKCTGNAVIFTVRTRKPFNGFLYVFDRFGDPGCVIRGDGSREARITVVEGTCGVRKEALSTPLKRGYMFNTTMILQFHPQVVTKIDQALDVSCFIPSDTIGSTEFQSAAEFPKPRDCRYTIRKGDENCVALDGSVGETVGHLWECDMPNSDYGMLVHNCIATSDTATVPLVDDNGCHFNPYVMETPEYGFPGRVMSEMSLFKIPQASSIKFRCLVSFCNFDTSEVCRKEIAPKCSSGLRKPDPKQDYFDRLVKPKTRAGYVATYVLETRRMNILETESLKANIDMVNYCADTHGF